MEKHWEEEKISLDEIRLSYSKLENFSLCPRMFYLKYVSKNKNTRVEVDNAYAQYGTLCHDILDQWAKGEKKPTELKEIYIERYDAEVTEKFPASLPTAGQQYYMGGLDYFESFMEVIPNAKILLSEQKYILKMFGRDFSGIIDMVVELEDGQIAIVDHKSSSRKNFYGKKGKAKTRQLYIYAEIYKIIHGRYPDRLIFNLFREGVLLDQPFDPVAHAEAMAWGQMVTDDIVYMLNTYGEEEFEWDAKPTFFFCQNLCDVIEDCVIVG